ncbi:MAG: CAP domain-containing protein [Candidatus Fermentibacteraceae bacterium]
MKSMVSGLISTLVTAAALSGGRYAPLDSLASSILKLDRIPTGSELLRHASMAGWFWPLGAVWVHRETAGAIPDSLAWGMAESDDGVCLITAPPPAFSLEAPIPAFAEPGDTIRFIPRGDPTAMRGAVLSPALQVHPVEDGSIVLDREGTWWLEYMSETDFGPQVQILTPIAVGNPGAWPGNGWSGTEILTGFNNLRRKLRVAPLSESPFLNGLASLRARQARSWGGAFHSYPGSAGTSDMMPPAYGGWAENIALGSSITEAVEMILVSPFHLASCIDGRYAFMGLGSVSGREGTLLVIILSESSGKP